MHCYLYLSGHCDAVLSDVTIFVAQIPHKLLFKFENAKQARPMKVQTKIF
jgi:hypothetical protein